MPLVHVSRARTEKKDGRDLLRSETLLLPQSSSRARSAALAGGLSVRWGNPGTGRPGAAEAAGGQHHGERPVGARKGRVARSLPSARGREARRRVEKHQAKQKQRVGNPWGRGSKFKKAAADDCGPRLILLKTWSQAKRKTFGVVFPTPSAWGKEWQVIPLSW